VADKRFYVKKNRITCFDFFGVAIQIRGMERYKLLVNSVCLRCRRWLCVMAGTYTGEIQCTKCGTINVFCDSSKPCEARPNEGQQGKIRRASRQAA
jgi:hypothetical protein